MNLQKFDIVQSTNLNDLMNTPPLLYLIIRSHLCNYGGNALELLLLKIQGVKTMESSMSFQVYLLQIKFDILYKFAN